MQLLCYLLVQQQLAHNLLDEPLPEVLVVLVQLCFQSLCFGQKHKGLPVRFACGEAAYGQTLQLARLWLIASPTLLPGAHNAYKAIPITPRGACAARWSSTSWRERWC